MLRSEYWRQRAQEAREVIKDITNPVVAQTCDAPPGQPTDKLSTQLVDMLGRFTPLYDNGTVPQSTEALARVMQALEGSEDALAAFARFDARQGYRPLPVSLGAIGRCAMWQ